MAKGDFSVDVVGLDKLTSGLVSIGQAAGPLLRTAFRAGGKIIQSAAQANVKDGPGTNHPAGLLRRSIKVRVSSRRGAVRAFIGTSSTSNLYVGKTFYGGFLEYGHKVGSRALGDARQHVPPHPFMAPAVRATRDRAGQVIIDMLRDGLDKAVHP